MIAKNEQFATTLKRHGYSITAARTEVFESLSQSHPLEMAELVKACKHSDRASVYRTIELFEKLNIVTRVYMGWKYKLELSDDFSSHHHHLSCNVCGKVVVIHESPQIEDAIIKLTYEAGFTPDSHQLEIRGVCQDCRQKNFASNNTLKEVIA